MSEKPTTGLTRERSIAPRLVTGGGAVSLAVEEVLRAALDGLEDAGHIVEEVAVEKAPVLMPENFKRAGRWGGGQGGAPGELRESARVELEREEKRVAVSFNTDYASLQHEHMDWHHDEGEAKFLEHAFTETRDQCIEAIADRIRKVTGG